MPNPAFLRARPDDTFWAARRVMAFTDEMIRAAVQTGQYSDPAAEKHIADTLIARRDAIGRAWLTNVNPVVDPALDASGTLTFANAAVQRRRWQGSGFLRDRVACVRQRDWRNQAAGRADASPTAQCQRAAGLPTAAGAFVRVDISALGTDPSWAVPVHAYFRRIGDGWRLVGFERLPD